MSVCPCYSVYSVQLFGFESCYLTKTNVCCDVENYHMNCDMTKPTKWLCAQQSLRSVWAAAQSDQSPVCAQWAAKDPSFLHADSEDWSDWADTQADLSLRWAHTHFVGLVMSWLIYVYMNSRITKICWLSGFYRVSQKIVHHTELVYFYLLANVNETIYTLTIQNPC